MKIKQKPVIQQTLVAVIGCAMVAGLATSVKADSVTVTDVTDWGTTPVEVVTIIDPYLNYSGGGVLAGINTFSVNDGGYVTIYNGFCIDPFHWSLEGPIPYTTVPLSDAPKNPATLNAATAKDIEELWAEYYSPTMSSVNAAGLQIAIWELVSANAVANDGLPAYDAFILNQANDYGASADIDSLADYHGSAANLIALTEPGQDYVINPVSDGGGTFIMLALTLGGLVFAKTGQLRKTQAIPANHRSSAD